MRVLVVEDDIEVVEPLLALLTGQSYEAEWASDGSQALQLARRAKPDVALLDIGLPGMNGWTLGRRLRELPGLADLPIVASRLTPASAKRYGDSKARH